MRACLLAICLAPAAFGQFTLSVRNGNVEEPAGAVYAMGQVYAGESATARFRLRNASGAAAKVSVLAADGAGFTISGAPPLPTVLESQAFFDFVVVFQAGSIGSYSAALHSEGVSVLLTATVQPSLTFTVDGLPLGASAISFGAIERLASTTRRIRIDNFAPLVQIVPAIFVEGAGFRLAGASPSGLAVQPGANAAFEVQFSPTTAGASEGTLVIGDRRYGLAGSAFDSPLPQASLTVSLDQASSARQGTVAVRLDAASRTSGSGTLTLEFQPFAAGASDPAIAFSAGARVLPFTVSPGDTQPLIAAFQTGTTAGTLTFVVSLGVATSRHTITIPQAAVGIVAVQGVRSSAGVELRVSGFDNTRAAGVATYTFFDAAGNDIAPGAIRVDSTADFRRFFQASDAGGNFLLRSVFPVTGDAARIAAFEVVFTGPAGTSGTGRTLLP